MIEKCTYCGCTRPHHDSMERMINEKFELGLRFRRLEEKLRKQGVHPYADVPEITGM